MNEIVYKDYNEMTEQQKQLYRNHKGWMITSYLGVKTSDSSLTYRLKSYLDETKVDRPSIWD